jgi:HEAT repeat protein
LVLGAGLVLAGWFGNVARAQDDKEPTPKAEPKAEPAPKEEAKPDAPIDGKPIKDWIAMLDNKDRKVLYDAVAALAKAGPKAANAVPALEKLQKEGDPYNQSLAAYALAYIKPETDDKSTPQELIAVLKDKEKPQAARSVAAAQLARKGINAAVVYTDLQTLVKNDGDAYGRALAAYLLPYIKPKSNETASLLVETLKDKNKDVARTAAAALAVTLGEHARNSAAGIVVVLEGDKDPYHRALAAYVLGSIKPDPSLVVGPLVKVAQEKNQNPNVKKAVIDALKKIDPEAARKAASNNF